MANVVGRIVRAFRSLDYGQWNTGNHSSSVRRSLDTPRILLNMMHTDDGHLWMPPAPSEYITGVSGTGTLYMIRHTVAVGGTIVVQKGTTVSFYNANAGVTLPYTTTSATATLSSDEKIWTVNYGASLYFGNSSETWKLSPGYTVTDITAAGIPDGYHSMNYRNRRFVLERGDSPGGTNNRLWYSDIGDAETFGANAYIDVTDYYEGDSWENATGSPIALEPFGDVLALFTTQGVTRFTGTDPTTNFTLRPTQSSTGAWFRDSLSSLTPGVIYFGGTPRGEFGFYLWRGNSSELISGQLNGYLRQWVEGGQEFNEDRADSTVWRNRYIATVDVESSPTIYVYDWRRQNWSTFDGWTRPTVGLSRTDGEDGLCVADSADTTVYYTQSPMFRESSTTAGRFRVGYEDEDQPSGLVRFLKVRLTVNALATGGTGIDIDLTATTPDGSTVSPTTVTLTTDGQHTVDLPLRLRGNSIDLDFTITPSAAAQEITVENLELVQSRKSLKVARVGGT